MDETLERIQALVRQLNETAYQYYVLDNPTLSDKEWDQLYDQLVQLEAATGMVMPDSPTHRVGGEPLSVFLPHRHMARLWSMDKAQSVEAIRDWARRAEKLREAAVQAGQALPALSYVVEYKFDGLTINLTYEGGRLVEAATRGNGVTGEAILRQVMTIRSVPLTIPFQGKMEVQGEGYMRLSALEEYNRRAVEPLKNPRNGAAGALRNLDPKVTSARRLDASFYNVGYIEGMRFQSHEEMMAFLRENHFPVSDFLGRASTIEGAIALTQQVEQSRSELDFMIDGAVIKVSDFATREALGATDKFPRWAVAFKFEAEEVTTELKEVSWELGRTGKLTPLAHLEPVELAGATIQRATLNNLGDIERKRLKLGARVWLRRSNEVIPEIMGRVDAYSEDEREILPPERCPACGTPLEARGAHLFCPNRDGCVPQIVARLTHFASRDAMDIETFSEKTAAQLNRMLGVCEPDQLYALTVEQLASLERFGEKKAQNLVDALRASRDCSLDAFIFALGIPNVGRKTARDLAERYQAMEGLMEATLEQLVEIPDIGDIVARSIVDYFADPLNRRLVERLQAAGVRPHWQAARREGAFSGMTVVVTGTLGAMTRSEAEQAIERAGGKASSSVSKKTSLVVAGESAGSKRAKAEQLGVRVIGEAEFLEMLAQ